MSEKTKISIIVPIFNIQTYLKETLDSILNQQYENLQLIVIDGGSSDGTLEIVNTYADQIDYCVSEKDNGQAHAINKGLAVADGDIVNWINGDDLLEPGALEILHNAYLRNETAEVFCGLLRIVDEKNQKVLKEYSQFVGKTVDDCIWNTQIAQPSTFYKLRTIRNLGDLNESLNYVFDLELYYRYLTCLGLGKIVELDQPIARFRMRMDAKTTVDAKCFKFEKNAIQLHLAESNNIPLFIIERIKKEISEHSYRPGEWTFRYFKRSRLLLVMSERYVLYALKEGNFRETWYYVFQLAKSWRSWKVLRFYGIFFRVCFHSVKAIRISNHS